MSGWRDVLIADLVSAGLAEVKTGPFGTQLRASDYVDEGRPVINVRNIGLGRLRPEKLEYVDEVTAERLSSHLLLARDLVFARKGAVDRHLIVQPDQAGWMQGSDCLRLRLDPNAIHPEFVSYALLRDEFRTWIMQQCSHGATMPTLNQAVIGRIELRLPPLPTQRRIAAILGAYDDLIEVNRRRIAVLEEMARRLFEEWFVAFRFPGHDTTPLPDTPHGPLPQGWQVQPIGDVFEFLGGGTPSKTEPAYWDDGDVEWFTPSDLTGAKRTFMDRSSTRITKEGLRRSSAQLFPPFSVMLTSRATVGVIAVNTAPATTNQGFITCLPNDRVPLAFLIHWLRQNVPVFIAHATGATFKEITKGVFRRLPMAVPPADLVHHFEALCRPLLDQVLVHERSQERLAAARDLLLPRLISGELTVADAERALETAA